MADLTATLVKTTDIAAPNMHINDPIEVAISGDCDGDEIEHLQSQPARTDEAVLIALVKTTAFAARKHRDQRRKNKEAAPYINHPIGVALIAGAIGGITDLVVLQAALLHDTVEDTDTSYGELVDEFGKEVADVVMEVTDDKSLAKADRKKAQVAHVPHCSDRAKLVKMCDKLYNLRDLLHSPPESWTLERIQGYCVWSRMVVQGARGLNAAIEKALDEEIFNNSFTFDGTVHPCCPEHIDESHVYPTN